MDSRLILFLFNTFVLFNCQEFFLDDFESSSSISSYWDDTFDEGCDCQTRVCPDLPESCPHGMVAAPNDQCGCCHICGNGEWQYCDPDPMDYPEYFTVLLPWEVPPVRPLWDPAFHKFGRCGWGLKCTLKHDLGPKNSLPVFVCQCQDDTIVCGSDGKTYETPCTLREAAVEKGFPLVVKIKEMCRGAPSILSSSKNLTQTVTFGKTLTIGCEGRSNPPPTISWSKDGKTVTLMGNIRVSSKQRPGPAMYTTTGWLQVFNVKEDDAGLYECIASNEHGFTSSRGTVTIQVETV